MYALNPSNAICSDICEPLINLWNVIKNDPIGLADYYREQWERMQEEGYQVYYEIRDEFNSSFLPITCYFITYIVLMA